MKARTRPIRAVVVDDTTTARELLVAVLQSVEGIHVVGVGATGQEAVRLTKRLRPDVVTMDIVMPHMDGLEATRHIMRHCPTPIVIVTGDLTRAEKDLTFEALRAGALTLVRKPGLADPEACDKLVQTVRLMAKVPVVHHWGRKDEWPSEKPGVSPVRIAAIPSPPLIDAGDRRGIAIIGMAASTGGPAALATVLRSLPADFPVPIVVVQHITRGFVSGLAEWLDGETPLRVSLAAHGDVPQPGTVLLALDDYHLQVNGRGVIELCKEPPYKGLRPSANYMFRSLARAYGPRAVGIVLTGMGDDGATGLEALHVAGGLTLAQDEQTCVVYGMPHEAVIRRAIDRVLTPDQIAATLARLTLRSSESQVGQGASNG